MDPLRKLSVEIERLRALCAAVSHSFELSSRKVLENVSATELHKPVLIGQGGANVPIAKNAFHYKARLEGQLSRYLRETVYVRLISALEVFLVDLTREVLTRRPELLAKIEGEATFRYGQLVSFASVPELLASIVNKECRKLQNGGFGEIVKFYRKIVGIDLRNAKEGGRLPEMYERRHLLVHRLGRVDDKYRHDYNVNLKSITVDASYLASAFTVILSFGNDVWSGAQAVISSTLQSKITQRQLSIVVEAEPLSPRGREALDQDYCFPDSSGERVVRLRDLESERASKEGITRVALRGDAAHLKQYMRYLKKLLRKGDIRLVSLEKNSSQLRNQARLKLLASYSDEFIKQIDSLVPQPPLPTGFYKEVAVKLSLPVGKTKRLVQALIYARKNGISVFGKEKPLQKNLF